MKNLLIGLIIGFVLGSSVVFATSDINVEALWNRVFDSTTNTIRVVGQ